MRKTLVFVLWSLLMAGAMARADGPSVESLPPSVIKTVPECGDLNVDATATTQINVTFSKEMEDNSYSWAQVSSETFPQIVGRPRFLADKRTCVIKYREFHPTCERCRLDYQVSTEVHHLQVKWHKNGSGQPGIADEIIEGLRECGLTCGRSPGRTAGRKNCAKTWPGFPAWHKTLKLQAVCDDCHYELTRAGL